MLKIIYIFFPEKNCVPTLPKIFRSVTQNTLIFLFAANGIIRSYHEYEGGIEKAVLRITVWHQESCRVMANGDHEGCIFLTHPQTNKGLFFTPFNTAF